MSRWISRWTIVALLASAVWVTAPAAEARTIEIDGEAFAAAAVIDARAPRVSWAGARGRGSNYSTTTVEAMPGKAILLRYDLQGRIPEGMRITRALWVMPVTSHSPAQVRMEVWRMIADWGPGVSHELRTAEPEPTAWGEPGGRGPGTDRALSATAMTTVTEAREIAVNVTRDVELWYTGAAPNHGWMINVEDHNGVVRFSSPIWTGRNNWKLRITYEPD
jgi:hypothetical protein